ncbi:hypothetical protein ACHAQJ_010359 [Trichoderma viride]
MKSFILAASAVTAVAGHSLLDLGIDVDVSDVINLSADLSLHLPSGLSLPENAENKPSSGPPAGYVNVWHPSHEGVVIDSCDAETADGWHWVHPCGDNCKPEQPSQVWTTSTVSVTSMHTVISCAPTITNCPANGHHTTVTTVVIPETTTICPVEASKTKAADQTATPSTAAYPPPAASSPAYSAPVPTNTAVVTLSTQTAPAYTAPASTVPAGGPPYGVPSASAGYPAPSGSAPAYSVPAAESSPAAPSGPASAPYYPAPGASSVPAYPVPGNSSAPAYTAPSTSVYTAPVQSSPVYSVPPTAPSSPAGGCTGAYCVAPPAGTAPAAAPPAPAPSAPAGNSTTPPPVNGAVGRTEGVSVALFAGVIAALFL